MRLHAAAELSQRDLTAFAMKQRAAELGLQLLDRRCKRRLRNVAKLGGARKAQRFCSARKYRTWCISMSAFPSR
jgi:hypothetical protein